MDVMRKSVPVWDSSRMDVRMTARGDDRLSRRGNARVRAYKEDGCTARSEDLQPRIQIFHYFDFSLSPYTFLLCRSQ